MSLESGVKYVQPLKAASVTYIPSVPRGYDGRLPQIPNYLSYNPKISYQNSFSRINQNYLT
jgi:hypothetical protein